MGEELQLTTWEKEARGNHSRADTYTIAWPDIWIAKHQCCQRSLTQKLVEFTFKYKTVILVPLKQLSAEGEFVLC